MIDVILIGEDYLISRKILPGRGGEIIMGWIAGE